MTSPAAADGRVRVALPVGDLEILLYPRALLRGTGTDPAALTRVGGPTPARDAGTGANTDADADAEVRREHAEALDNALTVVRRTLADPRLREAVALSNPVYHDLALAPGRPLLTAQGYDQLNKRGRKEIRTAHRYVRRLLAKTETNSFFGPTLAIRWDPALERAVTVGEPVAERCVPGISHWVVADLAAARRRSLPASRRAWRRDPLWAPDGPALRCALNGRRIAVEGSAAVVWAALDRPRTVRELLDATGLAAPALAAAVTLLRPALRPHPEPPSALVDPLGWLRAQYPDDAEAATLAGLVERTAAAPWPRSLAHRAGIRAALAEHGRATSRSGGSHYADRDVLNEDRSSPWSGRVTLGRPAVESVHRSLAETMPLLLLGALLRQADAREAVVNATGGRETGLVELTARDITPVTRRADALTACLDGLLPDGRPEEVRLSPEEVAEAVRPLWERVETGSRDVAACLPGIDLMSRGGPPGRGQWVVSECHDDSSSALGGITSRVQPDGERGFADFCDAVRGWLDTGRMATVVGRRRSRHITPELPGLSIELTGVSTKPAGQVAPAAEVRVAAGGDRLLYGSRAFQLYPGDVPGPLFTALSLPCVVPVTLGAGRPEVPRVVIGTTVLQRRRWVTGLPELGRGLAAWRAVRRWQRELGLPDRVFLRHADEPKPLFVDFTDPLGVDDLSRLRPGTVVCGEVLPALTDTWWSGPAPQPSELRIPVLLRWSGG